MDRRKGSILGYVNGTYAVDLFGENTKFRNLVSKLVRHTVCDGRWFSFCTKIDDAQEDLFSFKNKNGVKLGTLVANELNTEEGYRTSLFRYLLNDYLCYCEIPTVVRQRDYAGFKDSYTKCLVTSNIGVIARWLGIPISEAKMFYSARVGDGSFDYDDEFHPYVKLVVAKDGTRKVSCPRKALDLSVKGLRLVPLFALAEGVDCLYNMACKDFYNVTFLKDSGQVRDMSICFDYDMLCSVYKDKGTLSSLYEWQYQGVFLENEYLTRGYIKAIEVGTNLKSNPVRSISYARIIKLEKTEPDLTFINIDLDTVKSSFLSYLSTKKVDYIELVDMLDVFNVGQNREYNGSRISSYAELESWVDTQEMLLSTPFIKQLALFMIGNPQWFDGYTGERKEVDYDEDDYIDDDELDFG